MHKFRRNKRVREYQAYKNTRKNVKRSHLWLFFQLILPSFKRTKNKGTSTMLGILSSALETSKTKYKNQTNKITTWKKHTHTHTSKTVKRSYLWLLFLLILPSHKGRKPKKPREWKGPSPKQITPSHESLKHQYTTNPTEPREAPQQSYNPNSGPKNKKGKKNQKKPLNKIATDRQLMR